MLRLEIGYDLSSVVKQERQNALAHVYGCLRVAFSYQYRGVFLKEATINFILLSQMIQKSPMLVQKSIKGISCALVNGTYACVQSDFFLITILYFYHNHTKLKFPYNRMA